MALEISTLTDIDQDDYDTALQTIVQMSSETHPDLDIRRGAYYDLVLSTAAAYAAANTTNIDRLRRSNSLQAVEEDPTLSDDDTLDRLASNYGVTRSEGAYATGPVVIVLSSLTSTVISSGQIFEDAAGQQFTSTAAFTARTDEDEVVSSTDRLLTAVGDGTYTFTITVTASAVGSASNLTRGTTLTPDSSLSSTFVRAYVGTDFTGGTDEETSTQLAARIRTSWTARSLSSRAGIENLLRSVSGYENLVGISVIGYGDEEQRRDHSILPVAMPGRTDVWVKSSSSGMYTTQLLTVTATYQGAGSPGTLWRFSLDRDDAPGFYEVEKIQTAEDIDDTGVATYTVTVDTRGYDISTGTTDGLLFLPDVTSATEAAFSRYSTAQITFRDTDTDTGGLTAGVSTADYSILVRVAPGIADIQDAVCDRDSRSVSGDCLIRAAVPCFTSVTLNVALPSGTTLSATQQAAIKQAVADAINATAFPGTLSVAVILTEMPAVLPTGSVVSSISLSGRIRRADGTTVTLSSSSSALSPSASATNLLTSRTVAFFCDTDDVTLTTSTL